MDIDREIENAIRAISEDGYVAAGPRVGQRAFTIYENQMEALVAAIERVFAPHIERMAADRNTFGSSVEALIAERDALKQEVDYIRNTNDRADGHVLAIVDDRNRLAAEVERLTVALGKDLRAALEEFVKARG
jgi:hypothetical protein